MSQFVNGAGRAVCITYSTTTISVDEFLQNQGELDNLDINSVLTYQGLNIDINNDTQVRTIIDSINLSRLFFIENPEYLTELANKTGSEREVVIQNLSKDLLQFQKERSSVDLLKE